MRRFSPHIQNCHYLMRTQSPRRAVRLLLHGSAKIGWRSGSGHSCGSKWPRSTSSFELARAYEPPTRRSRAAPAPRDGHTDLGKLDAYHSSMTFTVVVAVLFFLPDGHTRTVNIFSGLELGLLARWDGCGRWVGPAGLLSRLAS